MNILPVFCEIDDFCLLFEPGWQRQLLAAAPRQRNRFGDKGYISQKLFESLFVKDVQLITKPEDQHA
jgi:hypothetical protein